MLTHQLPGVQRGNPPRKILSPLLPGWKRKPIVVPPGYFDSDIEWISIRKIEPVTKEQDCWRCRPMKTPRRDAYPALVLATSTNMLIDGHHRYWTMIAGGYDGEVPIVRKKHKPPPHLT